MFTTFNCFAASNHSTTLAATFHKHEAEKYCTYEECMCDVEHGSFTPLVILYQVAWGRQPLPLTNILPAYSARSGVPLFFGYGLAPLHFGVLLALLTDHVYQGLSVSIRASWHAPQQ